MRSRGALFILLLTAASIVCAQQGAVSGTVVEANGDPVRKAIVTLTCQGKPKSWATQRTDASGKFDFPGLPAGNYELRAEKAGVGVAIYGASSARGLGEFLTLADGENKRGVKLQFIHSSAISGRVVDSDGDPVRSANVSLLRVVSDSGQRVLALVRSDRSDDRGDYHFSGIDPGQYYLHAAVNPWDAGVQVPGDQYYGGVTEWKDASPITIRNGERLADLDFHLFTVLTARIRGHCAGVPAAAAGSGPSIRILIIPADAVGRIWQPFAAQQMAAEQFETTPIPVGRYHIDALAQVDGRSYSGTQFVHAEPGMAEVTIELAAANDLKGQVVVEGSGDLKRSGVQVMLRGVRETYTERPADDGSFSFTNLAGELRMDWSRLPRAAYIKSARLGDQDVRFGKFTLPANGDAQLKIVVSTATATIEGSIESGRAGIVAAPVGPLHDWPRFYYAGATDPDGKFKIEGIAPGKYKVFALEKTSAEGFRSPEMADKLGDGEEVQLGEGADLTVTPKVIPLERLKDIVP